MIAIQTNKLLRFIKSADFFKAYLITFSIVIPIAVFSFLNLLSVGSTIALGVLLCSPSDVPGKSKHRINGMLSAILLATIATFFGALSAEITWILFPVTVVLIFLFSYISIYGFRASLISFSGLLAFVLSFADLGGQDKWLHLFLIASGGLWYILVSTLFLWTRPKMHIEQLLAETMELTAKLLELKKKAFTEKEGKEKLIERRFKLQAEITEKHEKLREVLLDNRKRSGKSNPARRKLLIFIDLVDILELVVSNPVSFEKIDALAAKQPVVLRKLGDSMGEISNRLQYLSETLLDSKRINTQENISKSITEIDNMIIEMEREPYDQEKRDEVLMIRNLLDYEKKSLDKIKSIERVLSNLGGSSLRYPKDKENQKFITPTDYRFDIFRDNFSFSSPIFRHSLRLVVLFVIGLIIGKLFFSQNAYWIVLTVIVIMRPSYGLTKERSRKRILGTLIGGAIAFGVVLLTQNPAIYSVLAIITFIMAFSLMQKNYVTAATFITLSIVFVYALLKPNAFEVIQFRVVDTAIGAGLSFLGNFLLWPAWEYRGIEKVMIATIKANLTYLKEIDNFYHTKQNTTTAYKLARKQAFLEMGNLSAAFQRMAQEPKNAQKDLEKLLRFIVLNQTFLSSLASLGTFMRNHKTTKASLHFEAYVNQIINNLEIAVTRLKNEENHQSENLEIIQKANHFLDAYSHELEKKRDPHASPEDQIELEVKMREAHLVLEQLKWLHEISQKMIKRAHTVNKIPSNI